MIDWKDLAKQKATLLDIIQKGAITGAQHDDLTGILHLIDHVQDTGGDDVVYLCDDGYRDKNGFLVGTSDWQPGPDWRGMVRSLAQSSEGSCVCYGLGVVDDEIALKNLANASAEMPTD